VPEFDGNITKEAVAKIEQADPIAWEVAKEVDGTLAQVVYEGGLMWNGFVEYDQKNLIHSMARNLFAELEGKLNDINPQELVRSGKRWVPIKQFMDMDPRQRSSYYTTDYSDLVQYIRKFAGPSFAKAAYDQRVAHDKSLVERLAPKLGYTKAQPSNNSPNHQPDASPVEAIAASPAMPAGTAAPINSAPSGQSQDDFHDQFFKRITGR
jgi:hypothetical protein